MMDQPRILSFGYRLDHLIKRSKGLRAAGYDVDIATEFAQAEFLVRKNPYGAAVIGPAVPEQLRNQIVRTVLARNPECVIVMLYESSIHNAELADAVLNYDTAEHNLPETIRHLLSQRAGKRTQKAAQ